VAARRAGKLFRVVIVPESEPVGAKTPAREPDRVLQAKTSLLPCGLRAFSKACTEGPLAGRPLGERFRWLTAPRSTVVQPGPVHSGLTADPAAELTHLFDTLVQP